MPKRASAAVPKAARTFMERWIALFDASDHSGRKQLELGDGRGQSNPNYDAADWFTRGLAKYGFRVDSWKIRPYVQPNWSVFRTDELYPPPTLFVDIVVNNGERKKEIWLALSPVTGGYQNSWYVPRQKKKRASKMLDLRKERTRVDRFLRAAIQSFSKLKLAQPLQSLELHYSRVEGTLSIHFDTDPDAEPGRGEAMTHYEHKTMNVPTWADAFEDGEVMVTLDGERLLRTSKGRYGAGQKNTHSFDDLVGGMLVDALKVLRDAGGLRTLRASDTASFGVEEIEGFFGWPIYKDRGKEDRFATAEPRCSRSPRTKKRARR